MIVNALGNFIMEAVETAESNLLARVENNPEKAYKFIDETMNDHGISLVLVEKAIGRKHDDWTVRELARLVAEMRGIADGLQSARDLYPVDAPVESGAASVATAEPANAQTGAAQGSAAGTAVATRKPGRPPKNAQATPAATAAAAPTQQTPPPATTGPAVPSASSSAAAGSGAPDPLATME